MHKSKQSIIGVYIIWRHSENDATFNSLSESSIHKCASTCFSFTCRSVVASPQSSALENLNYTNTEAKLFKLNKVEFNHPQGKNTYTHIKD